MPDPGEDSKSRMLRRILARNSDDEGSDSVDTDSDTSNLDFIGKLD